MLLKTIIYETNRATLARIARNLAALGFEAVLDGRSRTVTTNAYREEIIAARHARRA